MCILIFLIYKKIFPFFDDINVFRKGEDVVDPESERFSASTIYQLFLDTGYDLNILSFDSFKFTFAGAY